jgi:hypothetical protein
MIFKYFRRKIKRKNWRFLLKLLLFFAKIVIITLVFDKNANFFAENCYHNIDPMFACWRISFVDLRQCNDHYFGRLSPISGEKKAFLVKPIVTVIFLTNRNFSANRLFLG